MLEAIVPMIVCTGMFAMIFGIVYIRSRENMALIEKGLNPRQKDLRPQPFVNLKWGLLFIGSGLGLLFAYIIDNTMLDHKHDQQGRNIAHAQVTVNHNNHIVKKTVTITTDTNHAATDSAAEHHMAANDSVRANDNNDDGPETVMISGGDSENPAIYFALIAIGGGIGLVISYRIEKKEWLDKKIA